MEMWDVYNTTVKGLQTLGATLGVGKLRKVQTRGGRRPVTVTSTPMVVHFNCLAPYAGNDDDQGVAVNTIAPPQQGMMFHVSVLQESKCSI